MHKRLSNSLVLFFFCLSLTNIAPASATNNDAPGNIVNTPLNANHPVVVSHLIVRLKPGSGIAQSLATLDKGYALPGNSTSGLAPTSIDAASLINARIAVDSALSAQAGAPLSYFRPMSGEAHVFTLGSPVEAAAAVEMAKRISHSADVVYAEPDWPVQADLLPNDPYWINQSDLNPAGNGAFPPYSIDMPTAWDVTTGDASMRIAVIDTGLLKGHPEINARYIGGYDFISDPTMANDGDGRDADASDPGDWVTSADGCGAAHNSSWHGTHVSGTIAASTNNNNMVAGINWQSKILPVRVLGKCGGYTSDIADAIRWSAGLSVAGVPDNAYPAKVLNLSLGGSGACSSTFQSAINAADAAGAVIVVAAGNNYADASAYQPSNCAGVIVVGASEVQGYKASYSNFGSGVTLSAPGGDPYPVYLGGGYNSSNERWIWSIGSSAATSPNGSYTIMGMAGTSQATPHVAGVISLMLALKPSLTYPQIVNILKTTATAYNPASTCASTVICSQSGILNAGRALAAANDPPTISSIADQAISLNTSSALLPFTVGDDLTPAGSLVVTGSSDNTTLLPNAGIVLGGSGANRTVTLTPSGGQMGTANVTLTVNDGHKTASTTFNLTVGQIPTSTITPTLTTTPTVTTTVTHTPTVTATPTHTPTLTAKLTVTATETVTATVTHTPAMAFPQPNKIYIPWVTTDGPGN